MVIQIVLVWAATVKSSAEVLSSESLRLCSHDLFLWLPSVACHHNFGAADCHQLTKSDRKVVEDGFLKSLWKIIDGMLKAFSYVQIGNGNMGSAAFRAENTPTGELLGRPDCCRGFSWRLYHPGCLLWSGVRCKSSGKSASSYVIFTVQFLACVAEWDTYFALSRFNFSFWGLSVLVVVCNFCSCSGLSWGFKFSLPSSKFPVEALLGAADKCWQTLSGSWINPPSSKS